VVFAMAQHHHYSITEVEQMIPFERDIFLELLKQHIKSQEEASRNG
jgi:hypothetical protein